MADEFRMELTDLLRKGDLTDADFLREGEWVLAQAVMELEVSQHVGAERYGRTPIGAGNGTGTGTGTGTPASGRSLVVPRVRDGSFFPALLEPRRRAERALAAVVQEAYAHSVSSRRVDDLVKALGMTGVSKSQVSRLCRELDGEVKRVRTRQLAGRIRTCRSTRPQRHPGVRRRDAQPPRRSGRQTPARPRRPEPDRRCHRPRPGGDRRQQLTVHDDQGVVISTCRDVHV